MWTYNKQKPKCYFYETQKRIYTIRKSWGHWIFFIHKGRFLNRYEKTINCGDLKMNAFLTAAKYINNDLIEQAENFNKELRRMQ
jgi:hypothetical protein